MAPFFAFFVPHHAEGAPSFVENAFLVFAFEAKGGFRCVLRLFPCLTMLRVPHPLRRARSWFLRLKQRVGFDAFLGFFVLHHAEGAPSFAENAFLVFALVAKGGSEAVRLSYSSPTVPPVWRRLRCSGGYSARGSGTSELPRTTSYRAPRPEEPAFLFASPHGRPTDRA